MRTSPVLHIGAVLVMLAALFVLPGSVRAQEEEVFLDADSLSRRVLDGRTVTDLFNVRLRQGPTSLRADRGVDEGTGYLNFRGNVRIIEEADTIDAAFVRYHRERKVGRATGGVRLSDGSVVVEAPEATHYSEERRTEFIGGVSYADSAATLTALSAVYRAEPERIDFSGDVELVQDSTSVRADSVSYWRTEERSNAFGRIAVQTISEDGSTMLFADRLRRYEAPDSTVALGDVLLVTETAEQDTLFIAGRRMILRSRQEDRLWAADSVRVVSGDFAAAGDSMTYFGRGTETRTELFGRPLAWIRNTQLQADTLSTVGREARIDTVRGRGRVFAASRDTALARNQQLSGRGLQAVLRSDTLRSIVVQPNAEGLFFMRSDDDAAAADTSVSALRASGDRLRLLFEGGEFSTVAWYRGIEGRYYAANLIAQVSNLSGYIWTPDDRPSRETFDRRLQELVRRRMTERVPISSR